MALDGTLPGAWADPKVAFTTNSSTRSKILQDVSPASGSLLGGSRLTDLVATSTDAAAKDFILWDGVAITTLTATAAITAQNVITLSAGTWTGFLSNLSADDSIMIFGAANAGNNGTPLIVTNINGAALTVNGTPLTNETLPIGARLVRVNYRCRITVAANQGTASGSSNLQVIGIGNDSVVDNSGLVFGPTGMLLISPVVTLSALPAQISFSGKSAQY